MKKGTLIIFLICLTLCSCRRHSSSNNTNQTAKNNTTSKKENQKEDRIIKTAKSYIGTPYLYGGTSRAGLDCSGLTSLSFKSVYIDLPRTSAEQSKIGKTINLSEIQPGDLIFFTDKKGNKTITHVGIITEVKSSTEAKFIHASTKLGVVENELYVSYYKELIIKATRIE